MKFFSLGKTNHRLFLWIGIAATVVFLLLAGVTWYSTNVSRSYGDTKAGAEGAKEQEPYLNISNPNAEVNDLIARVAKHILMPSGEIVVTTVTDADGLRKNDAFAFQYIKNGDKILWHPGGLIIYDPAVDRVVDIIRIMARPGSEQTSAPVSRGRP